MLECIRRRFGLPWPYLKRRHSQIKKFSMPSDEDEHGLAESLKSTAAEITSSEKSKAKYNWRKIKTVHLGWMHYNKNTGKYVSIRKTRGGGSHPFYFGKNETLKDIMDKTKLKFFPNGKSFADDLQSMKFGIGNKEGMEDIDFNTSVESYVQKDSKKARMYLLTEPLSSVGFVRKYAASAFVERK